MANWRVHSSAGLIGLPSAPAKLIMSEPWAVRAGGEASFGWGESAAREIRGEGSLAARLARRGAAAKLGGAVADGGGGATAAARLASKEGGGGATARGGYGAAHGWLGMAEARGPAAGA